MNKVYHEFEPIYHENDTILILGSIPSPKSRENKFYYGHPKNRFWKTLAKVFEEAEPTTIDDKKLFLAKYNIALWDVISSCNINKASDNSIKNVKVNDINLILKKCPIQKVFTLGKMATNLYQKYCFPKTKRESIYLPSTSPANCAISDNELLEKFMIIKDK